LTDVSSFRTALLSARTPFDGVHEIEHQEPSSVLHSNSIEAPTVNRDRTRSDHCKRIVSDGYKRIQRSGCETCDRTFNGFPHWDRAMPHNGETCPAMDYSDLPTHHADPFDRQIIAQALVESVPVVTPDEAFNLYEGLKVVW